MAGGSNTKNDTVPGYRIRTAMSQFVLDRPYVPVKAQWPMAQPNPPVSAHPGHEAWLVHE